MVAPDASEGVGDAVGTVTLCTIHKSRASSGPTCCSCGRRTASSPRLRDAAGDAAAGSLNGSPSRLRRRDEAAHLEEERRLFHVAITLSGPAALHATREADGNGGDAGAGASAQRSPFSTCCRRPRCPRAVGAEEDEFRATGPGAGEAGAGKITAFFKKAPKAAQGPEAGDVPSPSPPPRPPAPTPAAEEPTPASELRAATTLALGRAGAVPAGQTRA
ncbi:ATP-dependent DNA helicase [Aureococcus anophagefferens]|nr:ATP-dependent DNA helicase [Aureococcus anophagefferens]